MKKINAKNIGVYRILGWVSSEYTETFQQKYPITFPISGNVTNIESVQWFSHDFVEIRLDTGNVEVFSLNHFEYELI